VLVDRNGNPLSEGLSPQEKKSAGAHRVSLPAIKAYPADLRMSAALDVALFGHLTRATQRRLHKAGFSVNELGLPTYGEYRRRTRQAYNQQINRPGRPHGPY
jgi:hypothetical protein